MVLLHFPLLYLLVFDAQSCHSHFHTHCNKLKGGRNSTSNAQYPAAICLARFSLHPAANIIVLYHKCSQLCGSFDSTPQESSTRSIVVHIMLTYPRHSVPPTLPVQLPLANIAYQQKVQNRHKKEITYGV